MTAAGADGRLDVAGVTAVHGALLAELAGHRHVTLDLTGLRFVASVGAGLLLEAVEQAQADGDLDVVLPEPGPARRLLELTGLTAIPPGQVGASPSRMWRSITFCSQPYRTASAAYQRRWRP